MSDEVDLPDGDAVAAFWELARRQVGLGRLGVIVGPSPTESIPPPAWAFGDSPELADGLLAAVLNGTKTACSSGVWEYETATDAQGGTGTEALPQEGDLSIILDGRGHPRALVRTTSVRIAAFAEVDAEFARLEGEDDLSLEAWRIGHQAYFSRSQAAHGVAPVDPAVESSGFDESVQLVLEQFELRYPPRRSPSDDATADHISR
ncbi:ASCH domain-containing protein [Pengzhenrongella frigida]|uniref:ASCH domain-containing protein n=1 Tax=Pengzhenrongella frigida TaxID=1259133 RepID=A0A4Q5MWZ2_9MICO|nr:ASCH domain-containing protein [Cellulomonas sp. HLT2-17]